VQSIMIVPCMESGKKEGSKACCQRKFQKLRLRFLKIDARHAAYKAKLDLVGWRKYLSDQCRSDGTGLIELSTMYICTAPRIAQNQIKLQPRWVEEAVETMWDVDDFQLQL
jgi:hypothetical protein